LQSGSDAPTRDDDEEAPWALSTRRADATAAQQALSRALVPAGLSLPVLRSTFDETLPTGTLKLERRGVVILSGTIGGGLEPLARRRLAPLLVTLQATAARLSALESSAPVLIRAAMPSRVDVVQLTRVLRALAADALPSHDLETVLDALTAAPPGADIEACVGAARRAFTDALTARLLGCAPERVACAGATLESALARGAPAPSLVDDLVERIDALPGEPMTLVCVLCSPEARVPLADLFATTRPQVAVIALDEVRPGTRIIPAAIL
jgi:flagellar biosynthesis component FlhA